MANANDYGFLALKHLMAQRVSQVGANVVRTAMQQSAEEYNRQLDEMISALAVRTTAQSERYTLPGSGTLQPLDEHGNPVPVRAAGYYDIAFPIQGGGTAWGNDRVTRGLMTVEEVQRMTLDAQMRDADWMRRHMLAALLDNTTWTYADPLYGNLTIQPLANGDTVTYTRRGGANSTDTHYFAQTAAIADATNPIDDIYAELMEHPSNVGPFALYVPSQNIADVKALTAFVDIDDPDIQRGANTDRVIGAAAGIRRFGDTVWGKVDNMWVIEWSALPENYLIGIALGAPPVLGMREYPEASLQGLFPEMHSSDGNHMEYRWLRYAGFGVRNRVGAVVYQVEGGDTTYDIPTGYSTPLNV